MSEKKANKDWTILIYLAGNNDLDPEISNTFKLLAESLAIPEYHVIVQIARIKRPMNGSRSTGMESQADNWHGVRRYIIENYTVHLISELPDTSMADPNALSDFITWGIGNYPAQRCIVILTGHSAGFVGMLIDYDYTLHELSAMSIQALVRAFSNVRTLTGKSVDIAVMDTCFMNMIEIWHEFAMAPGQPVKYLLTPTKILSRNGMRLEKLIRILYQSDKGILNDEFLINIANRYTEMFGINQGIFTVKMDNEVFLLLKKAINHLAILFLEKDLWQTAETLNWLHRVNIESTTSILELCRFLSKYSSDFNPDTIGIQPLLQRTVIAPSLESLTEWNTGPYIYLPGEPKEYLVTRAYYDNLLFAANNAWVEVLRSESQLSES